MRIRIRQFRVPQKTTRINGNVVLAQFTVILDHFKIFQVKLAECPEHEYRIYAPSHVQLSMEGREVIREKAVAKLKTDTGHALPFRFIV